MCWELHHYQACEVLGCLEHIYQSYLKIVFYGEHCVSLAMAFDNIFKLTIRRCQGWTVSTNVKVGAYLSIFIGVIATSCFIVRNVLQWQQRLNENSQVAQKHDEGRTINHHLKSGGVWTIFLWVTTTSCFMAREVLIWKRHMMKP